LSKGALAFGERGLIIPNHSAEARCVHPAIAEMVMIRSNQQAAKLLWNKWPATVNFASGCRGGSFAVAGYRAPRTYEASLGNDY